MSIQDERFRIAATLPRVEDHPIARAKSQLDRLRDLELRRAALDAEREWLAQADRDEARAFAYVCGLVAFVVVGVAAMLIFGLE